MKFLVSSQECELLLAFESKGSLEELSAHFNKDISVISRNLKAIAQKSNLLEKQFGKWVLSERGKALNAWCRDAIYGQRLALERQKSLNIATTREFASRVLLPETKMLIGDENISVSILASDAGIERLILTGKADFGFDCGRPQSPSIAFKRIARERFVVVATRNFIERFNIRSFGDLKDQDQLRSMRNEGNVWDLSVEATHYFGSFSDMANLREACILGFGWAILPYYMVKKELQAGCLVEILGKESPEQKFGVWWLRERKNLAPMDRKGYHMASEAGALVSGLKKISLYKSDVASVILPKCRK